MGSVTTSLNERALGRTLIFNHSIDASVRHIVDIALCITRTKNQNDTTDEAERKHTGAHSDLDIDGLHITRNMRNQLSRWPPPSQRRILCRTYVSVLWNKWMERKKKMTQHIFGSACRPGHEYRTWNLLAWKEKLRKKILPPGVCTLSWVSVNQSTRSLHLGQLFPCSLKSSVILRPGFVIGVLIPCDKWVDMFLLDTSLVNHPS